MKFLRKMLDSVAPHFEAGGKLHRFHTLYEMNDTVLFTPGQVTRGTTHVRDALDLKRMMITVVIALLPCLIFAIYNVGHQIHHHVALGATPLEDWRTTLFQLSGLPMVDSTLSNLAHGALYFVPVWAVCFLTGGVIEVIFALIRKHEVNEGFLVTGFLIPLTLPPTIPLWQVVLGVAFGVIIGKEVFGGTGMNVLNPALTARAFLFFAYPAQISGDQPWLAVNLPDGTSGATWLARMAADGRALEGHALGGAAWMEAFIGLIPGSMGETSALLCLVGAAILILTQVGSWRTMVGVAVGTMLMATVLNMAGSSTNSMFQVPWYWHMVVGGWAFGTVFMATDPVSSAFTETGKLFYGLGIGVMVILVRVINPAYPEGMMLAILFMNMFAPLIDYFYIQANIKRRLARHAA